MNASDISNFVGQSPGIVGQVNGNGTAAYTATVNCEIVVNFVNNSNGTVNVTVNGIPFISSNSTTPLVNYTTKLFLKKGQTATLVLSGGATNITGLFLTGRSIE